MGGAPSTFGGDGYADRPDEVLRAAYYGRDDGAGQARQEGTRLLGDADRLCPCGTRVLHGSAADRQHAQTCGDGPLPEITNPGRQIVALIAENRDLRRRLAEAEAKLAAAGGEPG